MKNILISGNTDPGKRRKENQDAWIAHQLWSADNALLVVVDGVGGYMGGEKAAAIARESIDQYMQQPKGDTLTMLREAVIYANNRIFEERKSDQLLSEMCCVLTAVVADAANQLVYYVHVGDTRLYRLREGQLQKLTRDHSFVGIREDAGDMTEMEAMSHPHRNQILREVGSAAHRLDDEDFMDFGCEELLPGDHLLLCSDGLTDMVTTRQITTILATKQPLGHKVNSLIALANEMGGTDNITVVLFKLKAAPAKKQLTITAPVSRLTTTAVQTMPPGEAAHAQQGAAGELPQADSADLQQAMVPEKPAQETTTTSRKKGLNKWLKVYLGVLTLLMIAIIGWYFTPPRSIDIMPPATLPIDSIRTGTSIRVNHTAVPGPVAEQSADTLRINTTQSWNRIQEFLDSTHNSLVLVPAKRNNTRFAAIEIGERSAEAGDTLVIKNIRFQGFETGIRIQVPAMIKTENLVFENVKYPFQHLVKADSSHTSLLIMNNVKR